MPAHRLSGGFVGNNGKCYVGDRGYMGITFPYSLLTPQYIKTLGCIAPLGLRPLKVSVLGFKKLFLECGGPR